VELLAKLIMAIIIEDVEEEGELGVYTQSQNSLRILISWQ